MLTMNLRRFIDRETKQQFTYSAACKLTKDMNIIKTYTVILKNNSSARSEDLQIISSLPLLSQSFTKFRSYLDRILNLLCFRLAARPE